MNNRYTNDVCVCVWDECVDMIMGMCVCEWID